MVAAPVALDVAVGGAAVAVAVAVALGAVLVLPQAASASTSARLNASKGIRIGDPSPHEWSGRIRQYQAQRGNPIRAVLLGRVRHTVTREGLVRSLECVMLI
jgi:hypothetical protein